MIAFLADQKHLSRWWCSLLGLRLCLVECDGGTDKILERRFIDDVSLTNINGAARLGLKAGVKETMRIVQRCALEYVDLDVIPKCSNGDNVSVV